MSASDDASTFFDDADAGVLRQRLVALENEVTVLRQTLALRQSNMDSTYRTIFDSVTDGVCVLAMDTGIIVDTNRATEQLCGYTRDELLEQPITLLSASAGSYLQIDDALWQRAAAGEDQQFEWVGRHKQGASIQADVVLKRVRLARRERLLMIIQDIHERKERDQLQAELIQTQAAALAELSAPLIPISERVVVMPLIGTIDAHRVQQILETLLEGVNMTRADTAIVDITGVAVVDTHVAAALVQVAQAVKLLGTQMIVTGIRPEIAQTLITMGAELRGITTYATLQRAIAAVLAQPS